MQELNTNDKEYNKNTIIYCDSQATIRYAENKNVTKRNLHIGTKHQYIRDLVESNEFTVAPIDTHVNVADIGTKQTDVKKHDYLTSLILHTPNTTAIAPPTSESVYPFTSATTQQETSATPK
jgi:hypothetical protein